MKIKITGLLLGMLAFVLSTTCFGRIGETKEQCIERYGKPFAVNSESTNFKKAIYVFDIMFYENKADFVAIKKIHHDWIKMYDDVHSFMDVHNTEAFTDTEIATFLAANGGGKKWDSVKTDEPYTSNWTTQDKQLIASHYPLTGLLVIMTREKVVRESKAEEAEEKAKGAEKKAKEKKNLEGF